MTQRHVQEHIDLIAKHEQAFLEQRSSIEKAGDTIASMIGSFSFVGSHLVAFLAWVVINSVAVLHHFDPFPFSLLGTMLAMEAIILSSFILMRQARVGRRADERDQLMLQILLLTEKEATAILKIDRQIATRLGLDSEANAAEVSELIQQTSIDNVAKTIQEHLPGGE